MNSENKSDEYWKEKLTPEEYHVLREKGTEPAFSSALLENKEKGMYVCKACGGELFSSESKFDSSSGWPSFTKPTAEKIILEKTDTSLGIKRTEVICNRCGGHLGHVFLDGPDTFSSGRQATGLRYCINGMALDFKQE